MLHSFITIVFISLSCMSVIYEQFGKIWSLSRQTSGEAFSKNANSRLLPGPQERIPVSIPVLNIVPD